MSFLASLLTRLILLLGAWLAVWGAWPWTTGDDADNLRIVAFVAGLLTVVLAGGVVFVLSRSSKDSNTAVASSKNRESQWIRTADFTLVALFFLAWTAAAWPRASLTTASEEKGAVFFEEFTDITEVASLRIIAPNEARGTIEEFRIKRDEGGLFVIPSHYDYPVDAGDQLLNAATALLGLKKGEPVTDLPSQYAEFGVEEPEVGDLSASDTGRGRMVEIRNDKDEVLAHLIIGEPSSGSEGYRFVREPSSGRVYRAKVDPTPFSTHFGDWIESDLLDVVAFDITNIGIRDYSWTEAFVQNRRQRVLEQRMQLDTTWNQLESSWDLDSLRVAGEQGEWVASQLHEDEEMNNDALSSLRSALEGLEIADVQRKPIGLEADIIPASGGLASLSDAQLTVISDAQETLLDKGYWFRRIDDTDFSPIELLSSEGELLVRTSAQVEYTLRFGRTLQASEGSTESDMRRFLMVSARVYTEGIPAPELFPVPPLPGEESEPATDEGESTPTPQEPLSSEEEENLIARHEAIMTENQRMIDAHALVIEAAEQKVRDLNERFADWFYVISEAEFNKLHLSRSDAIAPLALDTSTDSPNGGISTIPQGYGLDVFRYFQTHGLSRETP